MGAYTTSQLTSRLTALLLGLCGGLCQLVWSHAIGMNCDATLLGDFVMHFQCPAWTELLLKFPPSSAPTLEAATLAAGIAGFTAGAGAMWRPRWAAMLFAGLAVANLVMVAGAMAAGQQDGRAIGLATLAVLVPLAAAGLAWRWGEYRG